MMTMIEAYLAGMPVTDRERELLRRAVEGRRIALWEEPKERLSRCAITELFEGLRRGERLGLGRQLGREIYGYYSELLELGLPQDRALELTRSLIMGLGLGLACQGRGWSRLGRP